MDPVDRALAAALRERSERANRTVDAAAVEARASERRRRRLFVQVVGSGLAVVLIAVGVSSAFHGGTARVAPPVDSTATPGVVPWINTPGVVASPTYAPSAAPTTLYAACAGDQLTALPDRFGVATGNIGDTLTFRNSSTQPCSLSGYPTSLVATRNGQQETLSPSHGTFFDQTTQDPSNLLPGQTSSLVIGTSEHCIYDPQPGQSAATARNYDAVDIGVPGGGVVHSTAGFDGACGTSVSTFGQMQDLSPRLVSPYPGLIATLSLPKTATAGQVLDYQVTLINRSDQTLHLDPCPTFLVDTYAGGSDENAYQLNCAAAGDLPPQSSRVFAMQLVAPDRPGVVKFGWSIPAAGILVGGSFTNQVSG